MRLFLCSFLALACLMSPIPHEALHADEGEVPTSAQFIKKAKESRIAFLEVVSEIRERMSELCTRRETQDYLEMLDDLLEISRTLQVEILGGDPVSELGRDLSRHSLSRGWLFIEKEETVTLLLHHEWADPSDAFDYLISFRNSYEPLRTRREILAGETADFERALSNIHALFQWGQRKKHPAWLLSAYCQLSADLSNLILQQRLYLFSQEERVFWTNNLSTQGGVSDFLFLLENEVRKLQRETKERIHPLIQYLLLIPNLDIGEFGFTLSTQTYRESGEIASLSILKMVSTEERFKEGEFEDLLELLTPADIGSLIDSWIGLGNIPSPSFSEHLLAKSECLIKKVSQLGLKSEEEKIGRYLNSTLGASLFSRNRSAEGTYEVFLGGERYYFTLIQAKDNMLFAGMSNMPDDSALRGVLQYAFFDIRYDYGKQRYEGSHRPRQETDYHRNDLVRFSFEGDKIVGNLLFYPGDGRFEGKKIEEYRDYFLLQQYPSPSIEGAYEAEVFLGGEVRQYRLYLYSHGNEVLGKWVDHDLRGNAFYMNFDMGLIDPYRGVIYMTKGGDMTTGGRPMTNWLHFRGRLAEGQLVGQFIRGGRGLMKFGLSDESSEVTFHKIPD